MGKRRQEVGQSQNSSEESGDDGKEMNVDEVETVNIDFEFFDPEEIDYHGIKNLLKQLLGAYSDPIDISALTDLIVKDSLGSTVKVDGKESDPYAFLTNNPGIQKLSQYLLEKSKAETNIYGKLSQLMTADSKFQLGLIFTERLINMPHEVAPPMYRMLVEDINNIDEQYKFDYYLIISKAYVEVDIAKPGKKKKKTKTQSENATGFFHMEDALFQKNSIASLFYPCTISGKDSVLQEVGIKPQGCLILIKNEEMLKCITELQTKWSV
ncbi:Protein bcp1 [Neolecta irregularis DAH-3]|uniref:Protein BCP1 n=1 Tax=Neolecta irregularis (strain DAH-3) TaxID=1198029 RepID=A0A1U7LWV2_NEOID|nr:Protein bcp1 [Neolecta irregularis DAH-3]|eukprot:OLL27098.1 Protein bcp1 [Neolecta irregularis DAH-3]